MNHAAHELVDQNRDLNLLYEEYAKKPQLKPFITYADMENFYPIHVIDQRFQVDHKNRENTTVRRT